MLTTDLTFRPPVFTLSGNLFCLWSHSLCLSAPQLEGTLALLTPQINIISNNQSLPIPLLAHT
jgi:hypothetical protein